MARDEHGMPMPDERLLPIAIGDCGQVTDRDGEEIELWVDPEFFVHAANNIIPAREIVRRLAEWSKSDSMDDFIPVIRDAEKLWEKMQKGGA